MKITNLSAQIKNPNRVNISVDGKFRFSLDISQIAEHGIRIGKEYEEAELVALETESQFGKLYARALEYCLMRPHSSREMQEYLHRKTRATMYKSRQGEIKQREGVSEEISQRVYGRLESKGHIDDARFARWWVESRNLRKGSSLRKLKAELSAKGVDQKVIALALEDSSRTDESELQKIIAKKRGRYADPVKFMQYLARQGFSYDSIKEALAAEDATHD